MRVWSAVGHHGVEAPASQVAADSSSVRRRSRAAGKEEQGEAIQDSEPVLQRDRYLSPFDDLLWRCFGSGAEERQEVFGSDLWREW